MNIARYNNKISFAPKSPKGDLRHFKYLICCSACYFNSTLVELLSPFLFLQLFDQCYLSPGIGEPDYLNSKLMQVYVSVNIIFPAFF